MSTWSREETLAVVALMKAISRLLLEVAPRHNRERAELIQAQGRLAVAAASLRSTRLPRVPL